MQNIRVTPFLSFRCKLHGGSLKFELPQRPGPIRAHPNTYSQLKPTLQKSKKVRSSHGFSWHWYFVIFCVGKHHLTDFTKILLLDSCHSRSCAAPGFVQSRKSRRIRRPVQPDKPSHVFGSKLRQVVEPQPGWFHPNGTQVAGTKVQLLFIGRTKVLYRMGAPVR